MNTRWLAFPFTLLGLVACGLDGAEKPGAELRVDAGEHSSQPSRDAGSPDAGGMAVEAGAGPAQVDAGPAESCALEIPSQGSVVVIELRSGKVTPAANDTEQQLAGVVAELGSGALPSDVDLPWSDSAQQPIEWIRVADGNGTEWVVASEGMAFGFALAKGTAVTGSFYYSAGAWSPLRTALSLRAGGKLAFYYGTDGAPSQLVLPPELKVSRGGELCRQAHECGTYALYGLQVEIEGQSAELATDQTRSLGAYQIRHLRTAHTTSDESQCLDWFVADTALLVALKTR